MDEAIDPRATRMALELWILDADCTQSWLAREIGLTPNAVGHWVSGRERVPTYRYADIDYAFGRDPGSFAAAARAIQQAAEAA